MKTYRMLDIEKKCLSLLLIFALIFTFFPLNSEKAYANSGNSVNGYVENISLFEYGPKGEPLNSYSFSKETTEYDVVFPDSRDSDFIEITVSNPSDLYFAVWIGDEPQQVECIETKQYSEVHQIQHKTSHYGRIAQSWPTKRDALFGAVSFPVEQKKDFKVRVGKYDEKTKSWSKYDEYTYHVTRSLTLRYNAWMDNPKVDIFNGLVVYAAGNNVSPAFDSRRDAYTNDYTAIIGEAEEISLTLNPTTTGTRLYVGSGEKRIEFTAQQAQTLNIADYKNSGDNKASIPITLEYGEGNEKLTRTYTLHTDSQSYPPVIKQHPQNTTVDKDADTPTPLTVNAETPEGTKGTLSYQWYRGEYANPGGKISGETESTYLPPSIYAGSQQYCCVVTNTIGKATFTTTTNPATYTVNLNRLTAPEFTAQPTIDGNEGSIFFVQNQTPVFSFKLISGENGAPIEGAEYEFQVYRNQTGSTVPAQSQLVAATVSRTATIGAAWAEYSARLGQQDITGGWYYFIVLTAKKAGLDSVSITSEPVKTVFKRAGDVVTELEGTGSENDPFLVQNLNDLQYVRDMVNGKNGYGPYSFEGQVLKLTAGNYALGTMWEPIGTLKEGCTTTGNGVNILPFSGILDGNGKKVTCGMNGKPLFGYVRRATVKNLNIFGSKIKGYGLVENYCVDYGPTGVYVNDPVKNRTIDIENVTILKNSKILKAGFIGGYASGVNQINIRNCTIEPNVKIGDPGGWGALGDTSYGYGFISEGFDHRDNIGSFAGAFNGTITNSVSYATVYGRKNVGGLVGMKGQSMGSCDILNSSFQGKIIATGDKVGGIVGAGYISGSAPGTPTVEIHNCYVAADIQGNDKIGGLVGSEEGHEKFNDTGDSYGIKGANSISDNLFYGAIKAGENAKNIGGILGYVHDFSKKNGEATNFYLDSCGASSGIGGSVEGSMTGVDKYAAAASESEFSDGTVLTKLNASPTSYQNWQGQDKKYPTTTDKAVVTSLSIEGEYKTEYVLGEELDLTGIKIYANWSDKKKTELEIGTDSSKEKVVTYSGYNKNTRGLQTVTFQYKAIKATIGVTVLKPVTNPNEKITVRFTMYGDGIHDSDKEGATSHTLSAGNLTPWISSEAYQVGVNATVWDLLQEVQKAHSDEVKFNNKGNYIDYLYYDSTKSGKFDKTTMLGEFTNGKKSGWMYTLNGTHPLLGIEEQFLNGDDNIVWHYTDDYTKEEGSDKWGVPGADEVKDVTTSGAAGSATTTAPTEVKVSGTTATATIKAENQSEILKQAAEKKSTEIILEVSKADSKGADSVQLSLDVTFVKNVADKTDADLTVNTENGKVTLDQETLKTIIGEAKGNTVTIEITKVTKPTEVQKKAAGANGHLLKLTIKSGDKVISDFNKGKVKVVAEIVSKLLDKKVAAIHIADDGKIEQLAGKVLTIGGKKYYEFTTPHFSTFALVDADELGLEVAEEPTVDVKTLTAKLTPVARSAKTAKKNVKVTTSLDKQDKALIKELKDAGYTVKYRFYRSTKKAAGYKAAVTKKTAAYTNTGGKKGTKYYYKVQVRVYDADGKLAAKTALKQCKYASRTWTKGK